MRVLKGGSLALASLLLAACATSASHPLPPTSGPEYVSNLMASDVAQAVQAQQAFEQVLAENSRTLSLKQKAIDSDQVDVDYIGKPQDILRSIAYRYGYGYEETGKRQDLRIVNVRVKKASPVAVLRSVSYQISYGAKVILDKKTKQLRLVYLNTSAPPVAPSLPTRAASPSYGRQAYSRPRSSRRG